MAFSMPDGFSAGGMLLWDAVMADHDLDVLQVVTLTEACRAKDRLDKLDSVLRGESDVWMRLTHRVQTDDYELVINQALASANVTANLLKQLLAALRLPDSIAGKRPQQRGGARGTYAPSAKGSARVSSLEAARAKANG